MISIDTVYQKVLVFANKEQRGYITPQEFNLFADQAQMEIFEQYFYDLNQLSRVHGNSEEYADIKHNIQEKIAIFENTSSISGGTINASDLYRLGTVYANNREIEEVQQNEILYINQSLLARPTAERRVYVRIADNKILIYPTGLTSANCTYIKKPTKPSWGYVVVNGNAMYDSSNVTNFDLHFSEESELVYKILKFAGVAMKRDDITRAGQGLETMQIQQEKQ